MAPRGSSSPAPFKNIAPVSTPVRSPLGTELHWRLLSHLAISRQSLANVDNLKALLGLYNFQKLVSPVAGRVNELKIESIRSATGGQISFDARGRPSKSAAVVLTFGGESRTVILRSGSGLISIQGLDQPWVDLGV